ncbi:hypothetical protein D9611_002046 [Ephemerocybe angulata]|uniref:Mannosyltransferase n=1 Tax=Ephemerocybe angulata TaxID=980116 RepID=A0A8H5CKC9_9AGAR|nr:hypothetical protein D9611_002046 [Tulosesus angulatus]
MKTVPLTGLHVNLALDGLILATAWLHVALAPYTKVEESFNLHAVHDVLMYGFGKDSLKNHDHNIFPGAVPRTFIGSIFLSWISTPLLQFASHLGLIENKFHIQVIVRIMLAALNTLGLCLVRRAVSNRFGRSMGIYYTVLTCSQFHLPFWMGRTVPNMFSLFLVNISTYILLNRAPHSRKPSSTQNSLAVSILTFAAAVFRGELALYLAPLCLQALLTHRISLPTLLKTGIISGLLSAALTISVDTYFWNAPTPLWPELQGILFNVLQGKSADWGVSPPHTYFTSFLPKLLLWGLPLSLIGMWKDPRIRAPLYPACSFVVLMSSLGHKEWRFIIYVVPIFNIAGAGGLSFFFAVPKKSRWGPISFLLGTALILVNLAITLFSTFVSTANYPGGAALQQFHSLYNPHTTKSPVHVHISNLAAQTGASLFTQIYSQPQWDGIGDRNVNWVYNKTEGLSLAELTGYSSPFTHLIVEELPPKSVLRRRGWKVVRAVRAYGGVNLRLEVLEESVRSVLKDPSLVYSAFEGLKGVVNVRREEKLWILERIE